MVSIPPTPTPLGFIYCTNISYFHVLFAIPPIGTARMLVQSRTLYFIYANHILSYTYIEQKNTYLFSDLQYVSYLTPLYFVDFTNKTSSFFSTARACLVILELQDRAVSR